MPRQRNASINTTNILRNVLVNIYTSTILGAISDFQNVDVTVDFGVFDERARFFAVFVEVGFRFFDFI